VSIRVALADDQELVRTGFRYILEAQDDIEVVAEASTGFEILAESAAHAPDVVLMDVRMPGMDGLEATRRLLSDSPSQLPRVLMLTTFDADEYVYEALAAGASGFILKDVTRDDLVKAVRTIAAGDVLLAPSVTRRLIEQFVRRQPLAPKAARKIQHLTPREVDVLMLMATGLSNAEIAATLVVSENTIKTHVGSVFAKLAVRDRVQAVICAYQGGLMDPGTA
jgi:DNA-binding NarL/FixJ family response regulator